MVVRLRRGVCDRLLAATEGLNPVGDMNVCLFWMSVLCCQVEVGLCNGPIIRPGESYLVSCVWVLSRNLVEEA